jgi:hypothetical protein
MTECKPKRLEFHALDNREIAAHFDGGDITSDAGGLLLREVEGRLGILKGLAGCFTDYRKQMWVEHPIADLILGGHPKAAMCGHLKTGHMRPV